MNLGMFTPQQSLFRTMLLLAVQVFVGCAWFCQAAINSAPVISARRLSASREKSISSAQNTTDIKFHAIGFTANGRFC
ncbi:MAG: hypothetical protein DMG97_10055 [Acidobacteria bacterium]|nr:MAG: hypothetical protein DMG98_22100 [Acidobacteriota bacterium]PYV68193.1 MAG: hypothetical protein DMG96_37090 [Acidobacteriota bacterium]PYV73950.1 MAG: hypothetical protein DMG97_10055 [Acidobacteriota bacterium]